MRFSTYEKFVEGVKRQGVKSFLGFFSSETRNRHRGTIVKRNLCDPEIAVVTLTRIFTVVFNRYYDLIS